MTSEMSLLYPEWQGYGENACVFYGTTKLADGLFGTEAFTVIEVAVREDLETAEGVLGLRSIAPRFKSTLERLRKVSPAKIFMIGGTCGAEAAPVGYLNERYDADLAVLWFDAHADLNTPQSSPTGHFHGMVLRALLGEGPKEYVNELQCFLSPQQVFLIGTRDLDPPERVFISAANISITTKLDNAISLVDEIRSRGFRQVYLHLDLDILNPHSFPNSLLRTPGGPTTAELARVLATVADSLEVVGFSVLEYCEHEDSSIELVRELIKNSGITIACTRAL